MLFLKCDMPSTAFCRNRLSTSLARNTSPAKLQLKTSIVEERYCSTGDLQLVLRLTFKNVGRQSVILYKDSKIIGRYKVSRPNARRYEIDVSPMKTLLNSGLRSDAPDESSFVTLRSGQSHSIDVDLHLAIYDGMKSTEHFLRPGVHILCIAVWTWYYQPSSAKAFRTRWRSKGVLWSDTVESMPMVFSVEKQPKLSVCSKHI